MSENNTVTIKLVGRIDSNNASEVEQDIHKQLEGKENCAIVLDAKELEYISSAGLRILLHLKQSSSDLTVINVSSNVYEIFEMTGFTEMLDVHKAYRVVDVTGCEEIGRGANGYIYRIDQDNVVKVYNDANALDDIQHEREVAKLALILGIPTAISYDVVQVGDSYGSVFELLNASSFSKILETEPEKLDWCVDEYVKMLKLIHSTVVPEGKLPDIKETVCNWVDFMKDHLPEESWNKLKKLVDDVPQDNHMIHGDYHTKNLELQNGEVLIIDMDTLAVGYPVFEFGSMYNAFIGFSEYDHEVIKSFQGFDFETSKEFWHKTLEKYFDTTDEARIKEVEDKARIIGYTRLIRRSIRRGGLDTEKGAAEIELWKKELIELLDRVDTLLLDSSETSTGGPQMDEEIDVVAIADNLGQVQAFVDKHLAKTNCPEKAKMQIGVAVEEVFINIANYAYHPDIGEATVRVGVSEEPLIVTITFIDHGVPYDPLAKEDPDVTLNADQRQIGGLGIFMTKQMMDDVQYEYKDGQNILTLKKQID